MGIFIKNPETERKARKLARLRGETLTAVIDAANARTSARFDLPKLEAVVYVRHVADAPVVRQVLVDALGADAPTVRQAVYLEADICRQDLLVEIEAHAVAPGAIRA